KVDLQLLRSPVVTLTASPHTTYSYDPVVLTAKVAPVVTGYGTPFGSVTFYRQVVPGDLARPFPADSISYQKDLYVPIGTVPPRADGTATLTTLLPPGQDTLLAVFEPDNGLFVRTASDTVGETVIAPT